MAAINQTQQTDINWWKLNPVTNPLFSYHRLVTNAICTSLSPNWPLRDLCNRVGILLFSVVAYPILSMFAAAGKVIEYIFRHDFGYDSKRYALSEYIRSGNAEAINVLLTHVNFSSKDLIQPLQYAGNQEHNKIAEAILKKINTAELDWNGLGLLHLAANFVFANGNRLIYQKIMEKLGKEPTLLSQEQPNGMRNILTTLRNEIV